MKIIFLRRNIQFLFLILIFSFLFYGFLDSLFFRIRICDGYAMGDWLINFQDGGFKRRGLSGELILWLSDVTGLYIGKIVFGINLIFYTLFFLISAFFISNFHWTKYHILLIMFPTTFFFMLNDQYAVGRKEILLFTLFVSFLYYFKGKIFLSWRITICLALILNFLLFLHELVLFFVPYFLIVPYVVSIENKVKIPYVKMFVIMFSVIVSSLIIFLFGGDLNQGGTWKLLQSYGMNEMVMGGILSWPKEGFSGDKINAIAFAKLHSYWRYVIPFVVTLLLVFKIIVNFKFKTITTKTALLGVAGLFLFSFPLFYLTIDWGRWLHIHFIMLLLLVFYFSENVIELSVWNEFKSINFKMKMVYMFMCLLIPLILFFFTMRHVEEGSKFGLSETYFELKQVYYNFLEIIR
jgi:hypothetical protein